MGPPQIVHTDHREAVFLAASTRAISAAIRSADMGGGADRNRSSFTWHARKSVDQYLCMSANAIAVPNEIKARMKAHLASVFVNPTGPSPDFKV